MTGPAPAPDQVLDDAAVAQHKNNVQLQPDQARKLSCSTLVLLGVAALYSKSVVINGDWREGGASPTSTKVLTSASGGVCPPQWLPVLLSQTEDPMPPPTPLTPPPAAASASEGPTSR